MFEQLFGGMELGVEMYLLVAAAGVATGIINTLAGSGSLITLPIFIFICGLPAPVANGTNRIGVILQSFVGIRGMKKNGILNTKHVEWLAIPAILGAMIGSAIAVEMDEKMMNLAIAVLMIFMLLVLLVDPKRWITATERPQGVHKKPLPLATFFLIGVYGGFIQAGVGIFLLAGLVLASKYSLGKANGVKMLLVFLFNIPALISFFLAGQVHLGFGLIMAAFQSLGALIAVRIMSRYPDANRWIHRLLIVIVIVSAIRFMVEAVG